MFCVQYIQNNAIKDKTKMSHEAQPCMILNNSNIRKITMNMETIVIENRNLMKYLQ